MRFALAVLVVGGFGCLVEVDYAGTEFRCSAAQTACPEDFECLRDSCVEPPSAELLLHWSFDNVSGDTAFDSSGNDHVGAISGATVEEGGRFGAALRFDGLGGSVSDDAGNVYMNGLAGVTFMAWVRSDLVDTDNGVLNGRFASEGNTPDGAGISLRYDMAGGSGGGLNLLKAGVTVDAGGQELVQQLETAENTQSTEWQHLALTWQDGAAAIVFIDGVASIPTLIEADVSGTLAAIDQLVVGRGAKDITTSWSGLIDDVRLYAGALSAEEIAVIGGI